MSQENNIFSEPEVFYIAEFRPVSKSGGYSIGITGEISGEEFSIESQFCADLNEGDRLEIKLKHPKRDITVPVQGEIIWTEISWYKYILGVRFHNEDPDTKKQMQKLISEGEKEKEKTDSECRAGNSNTSLSKVSEKSSLDISLKGTSHSKVPCEDTSSAKSREMTEEDEEYIDETGQEAFDDKPSIESKIASRTKVFFMVIALSVIFLLAGLPMIYNTLEKYNVDNDPDFPQSTLQKSIPENQSDGPFNNSQAYEVIQQEHIPSGLVTDMLNEDIVLLRTERANLKKDPAKIHSDGTHDGTHDGSNTGDTNPHENPQAVLTDDTLNDVRVLPAQETVVTSEKSFDDTITQDTLFPDGEAKRYAVYVWILNIRAGPSVKSLIVGQLRSGEVFISQGREENDEGLWLKMSEGYVFADYTVALVHNIR